MIRISKITKRGRAYYYHVHETTPEGDTSYGDLIKYPSKGWVFEPSVTEAKKIGDRGTPIHLDVLKRIIEFANMVFASSE